MQSLCGRTLINPRAPASDSHGELTSSGISARKDGTAESSAETNVKQAVAGAGICMLDPSCSVWAQRQVHPVSTFDDTSSDRGGWHVKWDETLHRGRRCCIVGPDSTTHMSLVAWRTILYETMASLSHLDRSSAGFLPPGGTFTEAALWHLFRVGAGFVAANQDFADPARRLPFGRVPLLNPHEICTPLSASVQSDVLHGAGGGVEACHV